MISDKMDFNSTNSSSNNSSSYTGSPFDEASVPLLVTYLKMLIISVILVITVVPAMMIIRIILTSKELHKKHYYFIVNLLVTDILCVIVRFTAKMFIMVLYLLNLNVADYHVLEWIKMLLLWMQISITVTAPSLSFIPLAIERFVTITFPLCHRSILTNTRAFLMGAFIWIISAVLGTVICTIAHFKTVGPFGDYVPVKNVAILGLVFVVQVFSLILITSTNIYLHHQITTSNKKLMENQQLSSENDPQTKTLQRKLQTFRSQIKLMISLQMLGGIDSLIRILDPILNTLLRLMLETNSSVLVRQLFLQPLQWSIPLFHLFIFGVYTKTIYKKLTREFRQCLPTWFSHRSKVIILNQNTNKLV